MTTGPEEAGPARDLLVERLQAASYSVGSIEVVERGEDAVDVIATLITTVVEAADLDAVTADLGLSSCIAQSLKLKPGDLRAV